MLLCLQSNVELLLGSTQQARQNISDCLLKLEVEGMPESWKWRAFVLKALIEARDGNAEEAAKLFVLAKAFDKGTVAMDYILDEEVAIFWNTGNHTGLINALRDWSPVERLNWLTRGYSSNPTRHLKLQEAAARADAQDDMENMYQDAIKHLERFNAAPPLRCDLAEALLLVRGDTAGALRLLDEVLDGYSNGDLYKFTYENPSTVLERAINLQSRVLRDLFVPSRDPVVKASLLEVARGLVDRPLAKCVSVLSTTGRLYHRITLARMALQMGPRVDFQTHLQDVINVCFDTLEDNVGWNDSRSVRLLSQALVHLNKALHWPRIERAARILMSAYFSELNPVANTEGDSGQEKITEDEGRTGDGESGTVESRADATADASKSPTANGESDTVQDSVSKEETGNEESDGDGKSAEYRADAAAGTHAEPTADEGDLCDWYFLCRGTICNPTVKLEQWNGRSLFMCIDCDCAGFCEACYAALQADKDGTAPFKGRRFCGRDHEHIKVPIEGWRGIKDGVMRIEGDEDVPFKEFLRRVREELCKEAWVKLWEG